MACLVTLDEKTHVYKLGDKIVPGVTEILKSCGIIDDRYFKDWNRDLGKAVHKACELDYLGTLDQTTLDTPVIPYLNGWRKFLRESGIKIECMEKIVYNAVLGYAGTLDALGKTKKDAPVILDIKTGSPLKWHGLQLAGYEKCLPKEHMRMCVYLDKEGGYTIRTYLEDKDKDVFLSAVAVYKWKNA